MNEEQEGLRIGKGGKLRRTKWVYDEESYEGSYVTTDVTNELITLLFENAIIDDDVTLRDIFKMIENEVQLLEVIMGCWLAEYTALVLSDDTIEPDDDLSYLELYWSMEYTRNNFIALTEGNTTPQFHGIGYNNEQYCIMYSNAATLAHLPVRLGNMTIVSTSEQIDEFEYDGEGISSKTSGYNVDEYENPQYTLGQIIYGIVHELSWLGSPDDVEAKRKELEESVDDFEGRQGEDKHGLLHKIHVNME